jgi:hypothetical protein
MNNQPTRRSKSSGSPTVFVGAHVPQQLYRLLVEEAQGADVCLSELLRRMLVDRYNHRPGAGQGERQDEP